MSKNLKGKIFYYVSLLDESDVSFFRVTRSTTNTCEVEVLSKYVVAQSDVYQFVEPELNKSTGKKRCKVLESAKIEFEPGKIAEIWDGLPIRQVTRIFLISY
jgi:hypothetical protein